MAFEYSTQGATLDFPNPYRIENQFLGARALLLLASGLYLLWLARAAGAADGSAAAGALVLLAAGGAVLVLLGILEFARAARQLRVFFGRGQPASLAPDIAREAQGGSAAAQALVEQLRQGAIALAVPHGALNGLLYSLSPQLVTAPRVLRDFLQVRFANLLAAAGLLLLFGATWALTRQPAAQSLAALLYLALGTTLIVRSYLAGTDRVVALQPLALAALLVFGLVGTVLLARVAGAWAQPAWLDALALPAIAFVLLAASVAIELLGLAAGRAHVDAPPPASTASELVSVSFNADPNLLLQEADRELQKRWVQGIPNRRYIWQAPVVDPAREAGNFAGTALEESQPMPPKAVGRMDWSTCLAFARFRWLALLDTLGLLLTLAGCLLWLRLGSAVAAGPGWPASWAPLSIGAILVVVGGYGVRVAHRLWGRLDFESTLTWLEFNGSFARAQVGTGSAWTDRVRSERTVVNVESMTLRAWVVQLRTVAFGWADAAPGSRTLVGMSGDVDAARGWVQQVRAFAQAQGSVVVPQGSEDARRLQQVDAANRVAGGAPAMPLPLPRAAASALPDPRHCAACGAALAPAARYCTQCGSATGSATGNTTGSSGAVDLPL